MPGETTPSLIRVGCVGTQPAVAHHIAGIEDAIPGAIGIGDRELDGSRGHLAKKKDRNQHREQTRRAFAVNLQGVGIMEQQGQRKDLDGGTH